MVETSVSMVTGMLLTVGLPLAGLIAALRGAEAIDRSRRDRIARQVSVTDAIHRQLGPVVAPVVKRGGRRRWRVEIAVPFESTVLVGRIGVIAHAAMAALDPGHATEIVLTSEEPRRRTDPAGRERDVFGWRGPTVSRAS